MPRPTPLWDRFWSKVDASGDCWEWTASTKRDGYGQFNTRGKELESALAHRVAWELLVGPIPPASELDHRCYNRKCVNPDHLEVVSKQENIARQRVPMGYHYGSRTACGNGHPLAGDNLYERPDGRGCRACRRESDRRRYRRARQNRPIGHAKEIVK